MHGRPSTFGEKISDYFRTAAQTFSLQASAGLSFGSFFSAIPTAIKYPETRGPLLGQMPKGIASFGGFLPDNTLLLTLQVTLIEGVSHGLRAATEGTYFRYGVTAFDAAAYLYLLRQKVVKSVNNSFTSAAIIKAATPDPATLQATTHKHLLFKPCGKECGETASVMADFMAVPESWADLIFSYSVANACSLLLFSLKNPIPYLNEIVLYPLLSLKYGRDFLNVKLSSVGMCEAHRQEIITANNAYCLTKGASFLIGVYGIPRLISYGLEWYGYSWAAGLVTNEFISSGLFAWNYLSFAQAELQITNTLPGITPGVDIFKYVHVAAQEATKWTVSKLVEWVWDPASTVTWDEQLKMIDDVFHAKPTQLIMKVCVGNDLHSLKAFLNRASLYSFTKVYEKSFKENVEWLNDLRFRGVARTILKILPERILDPSTKVFLITWGSKDMDGPAKSLNNVLDKIYPGAFPYIPPTDNGLSLERAEATAKAREEAAVEHKTPISLNGALDVMLQREKTKEKEEIKPISTDQTLKFRAVGSARPFDQRIPDDTRAALLGYKK